MAVYESEKNGDVKNNEDDNNNSSSNIMKWSNRFKTLVGIISCVLLVLQSWQVTDQYLQYNTVVTTELVKPRNLTMPAVTICAPVPVSFMKLCTKKETTEQCVQRLNETAELGVQGRGAKERLGFVMAHHVDKYLSSRPSKWLIKPDILSVPGCTFAKAQARSSLASQLTNCRNNSKAVYSLIYNVKKGTMGDLCTTYFSQFDPNYDEQKFDIYLPEFGNIMGWFAVEVLDDKWFPPGYTAQALSIAVHPPNMIPSDIEWKFLKIFGKKSYSIEYSRTVSYLLEEPYKTKCRKYEGNPKSKADCIRQCVYEAAKDVEGNCRRQWYVIFVAELQTTERLCPLNITKELEYFNIREECENGCPQDCYQEDYTARLEIIDDNYSPDFEGNFTKLSEIFLRHQTQADIVITHSIEMSFSNYVANVGGLAGLYLGISFIALYDYFIESLIILKLFKKKKLKNEPDADQL